MRIDVYSDTVCPWCFLGKRRLELAVASRPQYDTRVRWRPFELNPEIPMDGLPRTSFLASRGITAERVARATYRGYRANRREVVVPWTMIPAIKLYQLFPGLVEQVLSRAMRKSQ